MLPAKLIDYSGQLQISLIPAKFAVEAQARVAVLHQGQVAAECLIPASQLDTIVQNWRRARLEFPGEAWLILTDVPTGAPLQPTAQELLQQLQQLEAIKSALGDTIEAESFCEDCRIDDNTVGNRAYQEAFWFCCASEHLRLAIDYLRKILGLED